MTNVLSKNLVHIARRVILQEVTWVADGGMLYIGLQKMNSTIDWKPPKWRFFYIDCFEDEHIDLLLQSVF